MFILPIKTKYTSELVLAQCPPSSYANRSVPISCLYPRSIQLQPSPLCIQYTKKETNIKVDPRNMFSSSDCTSQYHDFPKQVPEYNHVVNITCCFAIYELQCIYLATCMSHLPRIKRILHPKVQPLTPLSVLGSTLTTKYSIGKHHLQSFQEREMCLGFLFFVFSLSRNFLLLHSIEVVDGQYPPAELHWCSSSGIISRSRLSLIKQFLF